VSQAIDAFIDTGALLNSARAVFRETPMPLAACLALWRRAAAGDLGSDPLTPPAAMSHTYPSISRPEIAAVLEGLPLGEWAMTVEAIDFLLNQVERIRPQAILEFGSGVSTLALACVMRTLHGASKTPHIFSVDQSSQYVQQIGSRLRLHGLHESVRFMTVPLISQVIQNVRTDCYQLHDQELLEFFGPSKPEFVVVDGPAADYGGRFGTIPLVRNFLSDHAWIYMDDALRDSELSIADWWDRLGYVKDCGVLWLGKGLLTARLNSPEMLAHMPTQTFLCQLLKPSEQGHSHQIRELPPPVTCVHTPFSCEGVAPSGQSKEALERSSASLNGRPTCLFLNTYYPGFLTHHYRSVPERASQSYEVQQRSLHQTGFGDSDFYSSGMTMAGWQAKDMIVNCATLQEAWAQEQGYRGQGQLLDIAIEQIRRQRPEVLYLQDLGLATKEFLASIRPYVTLIVGQIASPVPVHADLKGLDLIFSSFPHFVEEFRRQGITAYYQSLAFEPRIGHTLAPSDRAHAVTFVGGLSSAHKERQQFVASLAKLVPLECWGYGVESLRASGVEQTRLHGEVWGRDMFSTLRRSRITINHHTDVAQTYANNMRLFEATGCGALLVTDYKDNLDDLFKIGEEVVAYRSLDECAALVRYYIAHPEEARRIADRGRARTFRDHTYARRMAHTAEILIRHLEERQGHQRLPDPDLAHVSYGKEPIQPNEITTALATSWQSPAIPLKQRALVQQELAALYQGRPPVVYRILADALRPFIVPDCRVLEIGCASGYYYEVLEYLLNARLSYVGVDFSSAMVALAQRYYPRASFHVGDGAALSFPDQSFLIAISSCVLLHVADYPQHIREAARVASQIVVLHRTPVSRVHPTSHFKKFAYGIETHELRLNESEILGLCRDHDLELVQRLEYDSHPERDEFEATYVFRKVGRHG
jgi:SAM-dependent methyltransferase